MIERRGARLEEVHADKSTIEQVKQANAAQVIFVQVLDSLEQGVGQMIETLGRLVNPNQAGLLETALRRRLVNAVPGPQRDHDLVEVGILRWKPGLLMPYVDGLQGKTVYIELSLGCRAIAITRADQEAQGQFFVAPFQRNRHGSAEPGDFVISTPQPTHLEIVPGPVIEIGRLCAGAVAFEKFELGDVVPFAMDAGTDFFKLLLNFSNGKKHDATPVYERQAKNSSSSIAHSTW